MLNAEEFIKVEEKIHNICEWTTKKDLSSDALYQTIVSELDHSDLVGLLFSVMRQLCYQEEFNAQLKKDNEILRADISRLSEDIKTSRNEFDRVFKRFFGNN